MSFAIRANCFGHAVPPREHRVFADFEYASHEENGATRLPEPQAPNGALRELGVECPQATTLQLQRVFDLAQLLLKARLLQCSITLRFFSAYQVSFTRAHSLTALKKDSYSCAMRSRSESTLARPRHGERGIIAKLLLGALELHRQERALDSEEAACAFQAARGPEAAWGLMRWGC